MSWHSEVLKLLDTMANATGGSMLPSVWSREAQKLMAAKPYNTPNGTYVIQVTDSGGATRLYGSFPTYDEAQAYVERRRGVSSAPSFSRRDDSNYVILYVVPTTKLRKKP